ncbi:MAG: GGDEF domain-containing protein [Magnetococcales bacterium]|nr:GGDEF domain-containing protein [Magnetococcales bacterium]
MNGLSDKTLQQLILLQGVNPDRVRPYLEGCTQRELAKGDILLSPEQENRHLYLILSGTFSVHVESQASPQIRVIVAGESVGELSLIRRQRPSAWVVALEESRVVQLDAEAFWGLVDCSGQVARNLFELMARWLLENTDHLVENRRTIETLAEQNTRDALTGVHNRRWFEDAVAKMVAETNDGGRPGVLVMVDVDHFKRFNDTYGHQGGDMALITLGKVMRDHVRKGDEVARYGGEEFVLLFPGTRLGDALPVVERVRQAAQHREIQLVQTGEVAHITISQGMAQTWPGVTVKELLAQADAQLYKAKESGRNRVCWETPQEQ